MTPAKFTHNAISIVKHIANDHRMIAAATVLGIVFLLIVRSVETACFWFGHNRCTVLVDIRRNVWCEWARFRSANQNKNVNCCIYTNSAIFPLTNWRMFRATLAYLDAVWAAVILTTIEIDFDVITAVGGHSIELNLLYLLVWPSFRCDNYCFSNFLCDRYSNRIWLVIAASLVARCRPVFRIVRLYQCSMAIVNVCKWAVCR